LLEVWAREVLLIPVAAKTMPPMVQEEETVGMEVKGAMVEQVQVAPP